MERDKLEVLIGATLDTEKAEKGLQQFTKKREVVTEIKLDGEKAFQTMTTYVNKLGQSFKTLKFTDLFGNSDEQIVSITDKFESLDGKLKEATTSTNKYRDSNGALVTEITETTASGESLKTVITEVEEAMGVVTTTTDKYRLALDAQGKVHEKLYSTETNTISNEVKLTEQREKLRLESVKLAQAERERMTNTSTTVKHTTEMVNGYKALVTTTTEVNNKGQVTNTVVKEYTDNMGRAVTTTDKFNASGQKIQGTMTNISDSANKVNQSFTNVIGKVAKFYVATLPIQMVYKAISTTISAVKNFDDAFTELNKVTSLSGESLKQYTLDLADLGTEVGRTITTMTELATGFKKAGYNEEDSATLAKLGAMYQNTADEALTASEATSTLVSQMKAFGYTAENAIHITDSINQVSQDFAVSSADIGKGLTQAGASLQTYGNSFDQTVGLLTAGTEIFQGKSQQVARGLNQIASRVAKNEEALKKYGIATKDANGDLKSTYEVLEQLADKWKNMSKEEQVSLGTKLAGVNQYKIFSAVMTNFDTAVKATNESMESAGATERQNAVYMESLQAKVQGLKSEFEKLVIGQGGLQTLAKTFLTIATNALKVINSLGGLKTILSAVVGVIATIKINTWLTTLSQLPTKLSALGTTISKITTAMANSATTGRSLNTSLEALGVSATSAQLALGALTVVITGVMMAYYALKTAEENAKKARETVISTSQQQIESLESVKTSLENENLTRTELNNIVSSNLSAYDDEISKINDVNDARQEAIDKINEEIEAEAKKIKQTGYTDYVSAKDKQDKKYSVTIKGSSAVATAKETEISDYFDLGMTGYASGGGFYSSMLLSASNLDEYISGLQQAIDYISSLDNSTGKYTDVLTQLETALSSALEVQKETASTVSTYEEALGILGLKYDETTKSIRMMTDEEKAEYESSKKATAQQQSEADGLEDLKEQYNITDEEIQQYISDYNLIGDEEATSKAIEGLAAIKEASQDLTDISSRYSDIGTAIDTIESNAKTLSSALKELDTNGQLSVETQLDLIDAGYATALMYDEETGKVTLNKDAVVDLTKAKYNQTIADLKLLQSDIQTKMKDDGLVAIQSASGFYELAKAKTLASIGISEYDYAKGYYTDETKKKLESAQEYIDTLNNAKAEQEALESSLKSLETTGVDAYKGLTNGANSASSANSKLTSVINSVTNAYKTEIDAVKKAKTQAVNAVSAQIKALKKQKEEAVKAIEAEIKSLQRQKEARSKFWAEQLKKLERENEERERNIELQEKQEALAKAQQQRVMIFKDGQFQYDQNESAISSAQQDLYNTEDKNEYERQKQLIEDLRDTELQWYEDRIQALEDYKEQVQEYYEGQIESLEEYKEQLETQYTQQIEALEETRDKVKEQLQTLSEESLEILQGMLVNTTITVEKINQALSKIGLFQGASTGANAISTGANALSTGTNSIRAYAGGKGSIGDSQLAVVGENPKYREIVIGSKLNNDQGLVMNLKRGTGVVNANATNTLASLFHSLGDNKGTLKKDFGTSNSVQISISNLNLPQVQDGNGLVDYLQNFAMDMTQKSYNR